MEGGQENALTAPWFYGEGFRAIVRHLMTGRCYWCKRVPAQELSCQDIVAMCKTCKTWNRWIKSFRIFVAVSKMNHGFNLCWNPFECVRVHVPMSGGMRGLYLARKMLIAMRESSQAGYDAAQ